MAPFARFLALNELRAPTRARNSQSLCFKCLRTYTSTATRRGRLVLESQQNDRPQVRWQRACSSPYKTRAMATVEDFNTDMFGPLDEYDERVHAGKLRDDDHQRTIVQSLQDLHDMLKDYHAPKVVHPSIESLKLPSRSLISSLFLRKPPKKRTQLPPNLPKGLYMFGDVGSGKTMLMDIFYDTLPHNITSKTRIHFHNFMQDVHKRLHAMKMEHGTDLDAVQYVAADIAEKASVLCFDEFQCTDVADAMILRRYLGLGEPGVRS